jgi:putative ABC transport system substrate-binding protein
MIAAMKRREFIALIGAAACAWSLVARAQQGDRRHRIGVMSGFEANDPEARRLIVAFKKALQDLGWIDGRDIEFDYRWFAADPERIRSHAIELARARPSVILVNSTPATRILHREIDTVPVVFVNIADPVRSGFVKSLANPGGNLTGLTNFEPGMGGKWLELLKEIEASKLVSCDEGSAFGGEVSF